MRLGLRARLTSGAGVLGVSAAVLAVHRRLPPSFLTVVNYHRIDVTDAASETDEGTLDATPEVFDRQLRLLCRHMTPIALPDLLAHLDGGPLPPNPLLVTFDDGYRDNAVHALPALLRHGIRATFFIATHYVHERRLFWWDRICWIVKHARRRRFALRAPESISIDLDRGQAEIRRLLGIVKTTPGLDLESFLGELGHAAECGWSPAIEAELVRRLVMTWDDVRGLHAAGMDIGSHTRTHRVLQTLGPEDLGDELAVSRSELERELGRGIEAIAYPVGNPVVQVPGLREAIQGAGYRVGFSYGNGRQPLRRCDPYDVHRYSVELRMTDHDFLGQIALPWLAPR